jgi:alpha-tubulin suppressor-like RCC1 family protein
MAVQQYLMMGRAAAGRTIITGERWAFGTNGYGQAGDGTTTAVSDPVQVGSLTDWQNTDSPSGTSWNLCTVKSDGTLWSWGRNNSGVLGLGDSTGRSSPTQVGSDTDWKEAATFSTSACAIKTDGTLWTWGENNTGQLGLGDTTNTSSPAQAGSDTDWAHVISSNANNTMVMKTDGALYYAGAIGHTLANVSTHTQVGSESGFVDAIARDGVYIMWKV